MTIRYVYGKWNVTVVGDVCDGETTAHVQGARILWRRGESEESTDLLGTQADDRFSVTTRVPVCRHYTLFTPIADKLGAPPKPRWMVLRFVKDGYVTQERKLNLYDCKDDGGMAASIDIGTVFLRQSASAEGSSH